MKCSVGSQIQHGKMPLMCIRKDLQLDQGQAHSAMLLAMVSMAAPGKSGFGQTRMKHSLTLL